MTLTLSRMSSLTDHSSAVKNGRDLSLSGYIFGSSLAEARAIRNSFASLTADSGQEEPIVSSTDPGIDGMYWITDLSCDAEPGVWDQRYGFRYQLRAQQAASWQSCRANWRIDGADRPNTGVGVVTTPHHAYPDTISSYDFGGATTSYYSRTALGKTMRVTLDDDYANAGRPTGYLPPAAWYDGSPHLVIDGVNQCGGQVLSLAHLTDWVAQTSLVKLTGSASTSSYTFRTYFPDYSTPSGWASTPFDIRVCAYVSGNLRPFIPVAIQVDDYTPDDLLLRLLCHFTTATSTTNLEAVVTLGLRRGAFLATVGIETNLSCSHGLKDNAGNSLADIDVHGNGHVGSTSTGGNYLAMLYDVASGDLNSTSEGSGHLYSAVTTSSMWGVGCVFGAGSAAAPNRANDIRDQFCAAQSLQLTVGR